MSSKAIGWAFEQHAQPISKLVLLALADCSHTQTGATFPSHAHIMKVTGLSRESVKRHLSKLEKLGLIKAVHRFRPDGSQLNNEYFLLGEGLPQSGEGISQSQGEALTEPPGGVSQSHVTLSKQPSMLTKEVPPYNGSVVAIPSEDTTSFETFWANCPKKVGKKDALKAFRGAVSSGETALDLIEAMEHYRGWVERNSKPTQFVLHPATWLRQGRWNDELKDDENEQRPEYKNVKARLFEKWWPELVEDSSAGNENSSRRNGSRAGGPTFDLLGSFRALPGPDDETGIA